MITDVLKNSVEEDLTEVRKCKVKILILQNKNEELCQQNNAEIKRPNDEIENRLITSESMLKRYIFSKLEVDFDDPTIGAEELKKLWCEGVATLALEDRKIKTSAGSVTYKVMPDSWEYIDSDIIEWCKHEGLPYYHTIEVLKKMDLKTAVLNGEIDLKDVPGLTVTTQEPKFNYKLNSGGELL